MTSVNFFSDGDITPELTSPAVSRPPTPKSDTELDLVHKSEQRSQQQKQLMGDGVVELSVNQWSWSWGQLPERQPQPQQQTPLALVAAFEQQQQAKESTTTSNDDLSTATAATTAASVVDSSSVVHQAVKERVSSPSSGILGGMFNLISHSARNSNTTTDATAASRALRASSSASSTSSNAAAATGTGAAADDQGIYLDDTEKLDAEMAALYLDQKSNTSLLRERKALSTNTVCLFSSLLFLAIGFFVFTINHNLQFV